MFTLSVSFFSAAWLLKPDLFGLVPNRLDPVFYTRYLINLNDAWAAAGNQHYSVTRWTSYLLQYPALWTLLYSGLLVLSVPSEVMRRIGRRLGLSAITRFITALIVLMFPMFERSFTRDYTEHRGGSMPH